MYSFLERYPNAIACLVTYLCCFAFAVVYAERADPNFQHYDELMTFPAFYQFFVGIYWGRKALRTYRIGGPLFLVQLVIAFAHFGKLYPTLEDAAFYLCEPLWEFLGPMQDALEENDTLLTSVVWTNAVFYLHRSCLNADQRAATLPDRLEHAQQQLLHMQSENATLSAQKEDQGLLIANQEAELRQLMAILNNEKSKSESLEQVNSQQARDLASEKESSSALAKQIEHNAAHNGSTSAQSIKLQEAHSQLQEAFTAKHEAAESFARKFRIAQAEADRKETQLQKLEERHSAILSQKTTIGGLERELRMIKDDLSQKDGSIARLQASLKNANDIARLEASKTEAELVQKRELARRVERGEAETSRLQSELSASKGQWRAEVEYLKTQQKEVQQQASAQAFSADAKVKERDQTVANLRGEINQLRLESSGKDQQMVYDQSEIARANSEFRKASDQIISLEGELKAVQQQRTSTLAQPASGPPAKTVEKLEAENRNVIAQRDNLVAERDNLREHLQYQAKEHSAQIEEHRVENVRLAKEVDAAHTKMIKDGKEFAELAAEKSMVEQQQVRFNAAVQQQVGDDGLNALFAVVDKEETEELLANEKTWAEEDGRVQGAGEKRKAQDEDEDETGAGDQFVRPRRDIRACRARSGRAVAVTVEDDRIDPSLR